MTQAIPLYEKMPKWKVWFYAIRPRTLPICLASVFMGSFLVPLPLRELHGLILFCSCLCALCIQMGTNLYNDAMDFTYGEKLETRLGPVRPTLQGTLSAHQTKNGALLFFAFSLLFSIPLILKGGGVVLLIVLLSIAAGMLYSWGGAYSISRLGLSELFLLVFFGWGIVLTNGYLQTGNWLYEGWIAGSQMGFLSAAVIAVDNLRDLEVDAESEKRTLAVRFGKTFARWEITVFLFVPYLVAMGRVSSIGLLAACLPFLAFPFARRVVQAVWTIEPSGEYNKFLALCAVHTLLFALLTIVGFRLQM